LAEPGTTTLEILAMSERCETAHAELKQKSVLSPRNQPHGSFIISSSNGEPSDEPFPPFHPSVIALALPISLVQYTVDWLMNFVLPA
jgi:hypothetical protein